MISDINNYDLLSFKCEYFECNLYFCNKNAFDEP